MFASKIKPFDYTAYFQNYTSESSKNGIKLKEKGIRLIADYYNNKYAANITIPLDELNKPLADDFFYDDDQVINLINYLRNKSTDEVAYREALIIGANSQHSIPIIYLKSGQEEALLIANSIVKDNDAAERLLKSTNIPIYNIEEGRQKDFFSCYADALIIARDATARDKNNQYEIPNLLQQIKSKAKAAQASETKKTYYVAKLPNALLKTAQNQFFIEDNRDHDNTPIHKNKSLTAFYQQYEEETFFNKNKKEPGYLRQKGFKLTEVIEIQFYLSQIEQLVGKKFGDEEKKDFITQIKHIFRQPPRKDEDAEDRLDRIRDDIFRLACKTADDLQEKNTLFLNRS